ncbi:hypothetical protein ACOAKC_08965 [Hathewaya histolytica]|uniref:hypothetical protein n=1 Tax=Hathewaya histolytica TaxID=1498 RepID=UPI003B67CA49
MIKSARSFSKYFTGVKAGVIDFMFDTEEWFDETKLGNFTNEELDDLEETIYIFIGD